MRLWLTIVAILFIAVELFQWVKGVMLPFPVYVLGGALMAIASNYDKGMSFLLTEKVQEVGMVAQTAELIDSPEETTILTVSLDEAKIEKKSSD